MYDCDKSEQTGAIAMRLVVIAAVLVTVGYMDWNGLTNGKLLKAAEDAGIDVMVAGDRSLRYEQNLNDRRIAVAALSTQTWQIIRDHIPAAVDAAVPGSFKAVYCGEFRRREGRMSDPSL